MIDALPGRRLALAATLLCAAVAASGETSERRTTLDDQRGVAVTIYNENLALIKDRREVSLAEGGQRLAFRGVSAQMRAETALLRNLGQPGALSVREQNFNYDLLTPQTLLEKYVGRKVRVAYRHPTTGAETYEDARVLSAANGVVLKIGDRIETGIPGRIIYDQVPDNLRDQPTLVLDLESARGGRQELELSYLSGGLSWQADYVAELNADETQLDLQGWVTLNNRSGTRYRNALLQLVAGDVNQVTRQMQRAMPRGAVMAMADAEQAMSQESLFEYHLYTLGRPTTLQDNQTKQVALLSAAAVPVSKEYLLSGQSHYYRGQARDLGRKLKVGVFMEFANTEAHKLGQPLPKGVVRVYKRDQKQRAQFIGEDRIDHTPKGEDVRLRLGNAFDITADKRQTDYRKRAASGEYSHAAETAYSIELRNAKEVPVTVTVREPIPGDWRMIESSHEHEKVAAHMAEWQVRVPAEGEAELNYRVLVRY